MNKIYILFLCLCYAVSAIMANTYKNDKEVTSPTDANIFGHVVDKATGEHLPGITIILKGTTIGSVTDDSGHYMLKNLPEGEFTIEVSFVGFKTVTKKVTTGKGKTQELNFELEEDLISLEGVVVSANRNETKRRLAPTLVKVLSPTVFEKTNSTTLAQGLVFQPGVRVENDCQNCGYSQVRINGMEGKYTQILIDSRPIFSALAGVYGLEQIPANMIERVEVIRGGGSALFGSSAIAGTINIITKEPIRNSGSFGHTISNLDGSGAYDNNTTLNLSWVSSDNKMGALIGDAAKAHIADATPALMIALAIFVIAFVVIMFTKIEEPEQAPVDTSLIKGALSHRHFALGALAIFLYMSVEVGTPTYILQYLTSKGIPASTVGLIVAVYWLMMLIGRFVGASIGAKISSRAMITTVASATLLLVSFGMFSPETSTVEVPGIDWASLSVIWQEVPVGILAFLLVGLCTSVMWGGIFNMAVEGLGKYTAIASGIYLSRTYTLAIASGIFMTMVFGCAVMVAIQGWVADMTDYMTSYWVVLFSAAYILFYAAIGSKPSKKSE